MYTTTEYGIANAPSFRIYVAARLGVGDDLSGARAPDRVRRGTPAPRALDLIEVCPNEPSDDVPV